MRDAGWSGNGRRLLAALALLAAPVISCSAKDDAVGVVHLALTQVPSDVRCIRVTATASRVVTQLFDVAPGGSTVLQVTGVPTGVVQFTVDAFAETCGAVTSTTGANWSSDPVVVTVDSAVVGNIAVTMHRNGNVSISVDFPDGGMSSCIPLGAACSTTPTTSCCPGTTCNAAGTCQSAASASCTDTVKNGAETDIDCGGGTCTTCGNGKLCNLASDCTSANCVANAAGTRTCQPAASASCTDTVKNGAETDIDCGGGTCAACGNGKVCILPADCASANCVANAAGTRTCQPAASASCTDTVKNGAETDIDCGGGTCATCGNGKVCILPSDCTSANCVANAAGTRTCQAAASASCTDTVKNGAETDIDCGGGTCAACGNGKVCILPADCTSANCVANAAGTRTCQAAASASCTDTVKNGAETDIDCGGGTCATCGNGKLCNLASDCTSANCVANAAGTRTCQAAASASCTDTVKNGAETDIDCGGGTCATCGNGKLCNLASDCTSANCVANAAGTRTCQAAASASCTDTVKNGAETDIDCGGGTCAACGNGKVCILPADCTSANCVANAAGTRTCQAAASASCTDTVKNGAETDIDCGGGTCATCGNGKLCNLASDCASANCVANAAGTRTCQPTTVSPTFVAAGAGVDLAGNLNVAYPSGLVAGRLLILQVGSRTANTPTVPAGWTQLFSDTSVNARQRLYFKVATGTETGTIPVTFAGTNDVNTARMYAFAGVIGSPFSEAAVTTSATVGTLMGPTVATTAPGRLAVAFVAIDSNPVMGVFAGAVGGVWTKAVTEYTTATGGNFGLQLQIAPMQSAGTISGGTANLGGLSDASICRAFALIGM